MDHDTYINRIKKVTKYSIKVKRVYDKQITPSDFSILVDRLWPHGLRKQESNISLWVKDIAPSNSLRKWFNHDPNKWEKFRKEYYNELDSRGQVIVNILTKIKKMKSVTLLYAAKDEKYNNAVVLRDYLLKNLKA
jgi:uncharacterized protein YeaO (DUF488 family)